MELETITTIANAIGAPAFAVMCCFGAIGFALYKILPRLLKLKNEAAEIQQQRKEKQQEYAEKFKCLEMQIQSERAARQTFEALTSQRLDAGDVRFARMESKLDALGASVATTNEGVVAIDAKFDMLLKMKT